MRKAQLRMSGLLVALLMAGCGGSAGQGGPKTCPVTGTVTQGGKPIEGATVMFVAGAGKRSAVGKTDGQGHYTLTTFKSGDGAVPGQYQVSICKYEAPPAPSSAGGGSAGTMGADYDPNKPVVAPPTKNLLPPKYANAATSGLTATVTEGKENKADFALP